MKRIAAVCLIGLACAATGVQAQTEISNCPAPYVWNFQSHTCEVPQLCVDSNGHVAPCNGATPEPVTCVLSYTWTKGDPDHARLTQISSACVNGLEMELATNRVMHALLSGQ